MDIRYSLENEHSKLATTTIVSYVGKDAKRFKEVFELFISSDKLLAQRAAWAFGDIGVTYPQLALPYLSKLIQLLKQPGLHPALYRNTLRVLESMTIPEKYHATLLDQCLQFIQNQQQPEAIRAFAITVAANIAKTYPELSKELRLILNELQQLSPKPAVSFRIKKALKELKV